MMPLYQTSRWPHAGRLLRCLLCLGATTAAALGANINQRPNIIVLMADNWLYDHASANGDPVVNTPVFDRLAREGARFTHAYCPVPSCGPTRSSIVTGRAAHQLEDLANHGSIFHGKFRVFVDALAVVGYHVGYFNKGWAPGVYLGHGRTETPLGKRYRDFNEFLKARPADRPLFFWVGDNQTALHSWKRGSGAAAGLDPAKVRVPAYLPDAPVVREEITDYLASAQRTDSAFGEVIARLETLGELENTIIIHTSDNGWQMPHGLGNLYAAGTHVPMAVRWPGRVQPGRVINDFISLTDLAPTILEMAGLYPWPEMTGRSFVDVLSGRPSAVARDHVFLERERHANVRRGDLSYPMRAVRTRDYLYIRNIRPNRWPAGDPKVYLSVGDYGDIDGSRTKLHMLAHQDDPAMQRLFRLNFRKRPAEELYDLRKDRDQIDNIADRPEFAAIKQQLSAKVDAWMKETDDPRVDPDCDKFDTYPFVSGGPAPELREWAAEKPPPGNLR
jgi:N-sulfoglucosamine sulfohydrolase